MEGTLDNYFETLASGNVTSVTDGLMEAYTKQTLEEALEERVKIRDAVEESSASPSPPPPPLLAQLTDARKEFKDAIAKYNTIKDKQMHLHEVKAAIRSATNDAIRKIDMVNEAITASASLTTTSENLKDLFCRYRDDAEAQADIDLVILDAGANEAKAKIKELGFLFSFAKGGTVGYPCPICMSSEVTQFCEPCGHTYCSSCMKSTYCYICRMKVNKKHKLFFV